MRRLCGLHRATDHADGGVRRQNSECVITRDRVPGVPCPSAVVADRWGEVVYVATASDVADLPSAQELVDWVTYLQTQCPECEGEAR